ncbi:hypothetical protein APV28_3316 [Comamonas testosteroni]|nr:hypothetical protein APV28_3316 [Comamonas testosteroni]
MTPSAASASLAGIAIAGSASALSMSQRLCATWECRLIQFE